MKWTVLSDNRSHDSRLSTEHGLSILLETNWHKILLDTGASALFMRNAEQLGIDLRDVDYVFVSHGHSDHAGGLQYFLECNQQAKVIVSPHALTGRFFSERGGMHSISTTKLKIIIDRFVPVDKTCQIDNSLSIIAHIPQKLPIPKGNQHLYVQDVDGNYVLDTFQHELALYTEGLLFTGCAHSGLENILEACHWPVHTVVGGFHLLDGLETSDELISMAHRLKTNHPTTQFYTSHCTGNGVFELMHDVMGNQLHAFSLGTECIIDKVLQ